MLEMGVTGGIGITPEGIGHAISDNTLAVPIYQRSYAWEEEHVQELFGDLANAIADGDEEYFLGSIVVTKGKDGLLEVVDGQQRLTTITILIAAVRDYFFINKDEQAATEIEREYLSSIHMRTREHIPKLRLNEYDHDYFVKRVLSYSNSADRKVLPLKDSHKNLDQAAILAAKHIRDIIQPYPDKPARLLDWLDFLRDKARVIWVTVPDDQNAFVIFETLNDRGADLSIADLLKNYLFRLAGDRISEAQQRWMAMMGALETLSRENIAVTYIRHLWESINGAVRERVLYSEIKKNIKNKQKAIDFSTALGEEANSYASLLNPNSQLWNAYGSGTRGHLETLILLQAEQIRPLMLAVAKHFTVHEGQKAFRLFVSWSVRFLIAGGGGGGTMERNYSIRAVQIREGKIATTAALAKSMVGVAKNDSEFEEAFATARVSQAHLARYYLRTLEDQAKGLIDQEYVPNKDQHVINLEHVLPQVPGPNWAHIKGDEAEAYYRRIGNLALLKTTTNVKIDRLQFTEKAKHFKDSGYILTSQIASAVDWTPTEIAERQKRLAALAVKAWPLTVR
jgi:hypothetical protein